MMDSDIEAILSRHVSEDTAAGLDFSSPGGEREMEFPDSYFLGCPGFVQLHKITHL